jgi:hypothetical protein
VYVFRRTAEDVWEEAAKLTASDGASSDRFGSRVACQDHVAVVGAFGKDEGGENRGAAYVFRRDGAGTWREQDRLRVDGLEAGDFFGFPVVLTEDAVFAGAIGDDTQGEDAGTVYVLPLSEATSTDQAIPEISFSAPIAYPNPATTTTRITFTLPQSAEVAVTVFDLLGRRVHERPAHRLAPGPHEVHLDLTGYPAGVYLYRVQMQSDGRATARTGRIVLQ